MGEERRLDPLGEIRRQPFAHAARLEHALDLVLAGDEVIPVMRALRQHGIQITALHSHMVGEEPRLYFMHFWADANAVALARGLRAALELTASKSP